MPQGAAHSRLEGHEGVEARPAAGLLHVGRHPAQQPPLRARGEVEDLVADRAADPGGSLAPVPEDAEGQVLDGEVGGGVVRRLDPAAERGVVRAVDLRDHASTPRARSSATGSAKEQEPKDVAKSRRAFATSSADTRSRRQARPPSSRRKAEASCSRRTTSMSASEAPAAREGGRGEDVQEAVHHRPRAARRVRERVLGAHGVVEAGGRLPPHSRRRAGCDEAGDVGGVGDGFRHDAAGADLRPRRHAPSPRRGARRGRRRAAPRRRRRARRAARRGRLAASSGLTALSSTASTTARPALDALNAVTRAESPWTSAPRSALSRHGSPAPGSGRCASPDRESSASRAAGRTKRPSIHASGERRHRAYSATASSIDSAAGGKRPA